MKEIVKILTLLLLVTFILPQQGISAEGDTTKITSHLDQHMKFPPGNRTYTNKVKFPDGSTTYRKILMKYTLGCPPGGCSTWDYTTKVVLNRPTGTFDSNLVLKPYFKVDGTALDSALFSFDTTYVTFFDSTNKITDSIASDSVLFRIYGDSLMPDLQTDSFWAFPGGYYKYYHDTSGAIIDSSFVTGDSLWYQSYYNTYNKFEVVDRFELGRLITPYFGDYYPYDFTFDVTDYAGLLKDSVDISLVFSGWQDGFLATIDFLFIEGTPPRDFKRATSLYYGSFQYGRVNNRIETHLVPTDVDFYNDEAGAIINYTPSGHSFGGNENCAEFCKKNYHIYVNSNLRFSNLMWRDDCGRNPLYPQGGTWVYDRANWCPGLDAIRHTHELTSFINFGQPNEINIDLDPYTYNGSASPGTNPNPSWTIDATVITFGAPNFTLDAEIQEIIAPNNHILKNRENPICGNPIVRIRNTGSTTLTSLDITYGVKGGAMSTFNWTGNLKFLESEVVELTNPDWAPWTGPNIYEVSVSNPNGSNDEYDQNNVMTSAFDIPDQMPSKFVIYFRAGQAFENSYGVKDDQGNVVFFNGNPSSNQVYSDTIELEKGCYEFYLFDQGDDGLRFFGQTSGRVELYDAETRNKRLQSLELEFGSELKKRFTVGYQLTGVDAAQYNRKRFDIYPNPSEGQFTLELEYFNEEEVNVNIFHITGKKVMYRSVEVIQNIQQERVDLSGMAPGIYIVTVQSGDYISNRKVVIQ